MAALTSRRVVALFAALCALLPAFALPSSAGPAKGLGGTTDFEVVLASTADFAFSVLGVLGGDLYMFGSQGESAQQNAGVWRRRAGVPRWNKLGDASRPLDYNRFANAGATAYQGRLYLGDRRVGQLFRLDLDPFGIDPNDGGPAFVDVTPVLVLPSHEDVFVGPAWNERLMIGTFGRDVGGEVTNGLPGLYSFDGETATLVQEFTEMGMGGYVLSIQPVNKDLYVSVVAADRVHGELWRVDQDSVATRVWSGDRAYWLAERDARLVGLRACFDGQSTLPHLATWDDELADWTDVTPEFSAPGRNDGIRRVGHELLIYAHSDGVWSQRAGDPPRKIASKPRVASTAVYAGSLVVTGNQPPSLYSRLLTAAEAGLPAG